VLRGLANWRSQPAYSRYLEVFTQSYHDVIAQFARLDAAEARALAHKLKGAAAALALPDVSTEAAELERALGHHDSADTGPLAAALQVAFDSIARYTAQYGAGPAATGADPTPEAPAAAAPLDAAAQARLGALISAALTALDSDDPDVIEPALQQLGAQLTAAQLAPLQAAVDGFDFRAAEARLRQLASTLGAELPS
jgi:HPt (histidine-containing phosphotransfer) domain-containing protein